MVRILAAAAAVSLLLSGCGGEDAVDRDATATSGGERGGSGGADGEGGEGGMTNSSAGRGSPTTEVEHHGGGNGDGKAAATATTTTAFARSAASQTVPIRLVDFSFVDMPATVKGPRVFFRAVNDGPSPHEVEVVDEGGTSVGAVPPFAKGQQRDLAVEVQPGTYTMRCLVKEGAKTHAQLGMTSTFVVQ